MEEYVWCRTTNSRILFAIMQYMKRRRDYGLTITTDGLLLYKADLYDPGVPVQSIVLSGDDCGFIVDSLHRALNAVCKKLTDENVTVGKKVSYRKKAKQDVKFKRYVLNKSQKSSYKSSKKPRRDKAVQYRAYAPVSDGSEAVCMLLKLNYEPVKDDFKNILDVHAFNIDDAEKLFSIPVRHNKG